MIVNHSQGYKLILNVDQINATLDRGYLGMEHVKIAKFTLKYWPMESVVDQTNVPKGKSCLRMVLARFVKIMKLHLEIKLVARNQDVTTDKR